MVTGRILVESRAPSPGASGPRMKRLLANAILLIALTAAAQAQTHTTVRHYRERIDDTPPEIAQAEDAIQKNDFTGAETLLKKAIDKDPKNYQAWFDLGFVLNRLGRVEDSIHAYRQSVAAKPEVFETNLNLGLMLVRFNSPEAERYLRRLIAKPPNLHRRIPNLIFLPVCCKNGKRNSPPLKRNTNKSWPSIRTRQKPRSASPTCT
jgi:Flp pilus assembly protein TadD